MNAPGKTALHAAYPGCRGLTLVEILIALVILSIGLLGLAGLQTLSLKFNSSAFYRTQATALSYGLADRMRANRRAALDGKYNIAFDTPPACGAPETDGTVAEQDIAAWRMALSCRLPGGTGSVVRTGTSDEFTLTVQWDDSHGEQSAMTFEFTTVL